MGFVILLGYGLLMYSLGMKRNDGEAYTAATSSRRRQLS
jgi:hypothetical protein